jgi:hypothetical protein
VVECTGLENRRPFTGLVSSNLTLSATGKMRPRIGGRHFSSRGRVRGRIHWSSTKSRERFWTPERFGDGARSARARMARVNLTLSATGKMRPTSAAAIFAHTLC